MSRPKRYVHHLTAAKEEALFACDLYNQHRQARSLEAFLVHMGIAWCNLFQAICERDGVDYFYRQRDGRHFVYVDGERKTWDLAKMVQERLHDGNDPVRRNIEFFIGLRNKVEHRLTASERAALRNVVAGKAQSYVRNFERLLSAEFGSGESLAHDLHLPLFLASLDEHAVQALKEVRKTLPRGLVSYIDEFDANVGADVAAHEAYDFKMYLIPKTASARASDVALEFVNVKNLTDQQRQQLDQALVIIRDKQVEVANLRRMKPGAIIKRIKEAHPKFSINQHSWAWRFHKVRPPNTKDKAAKLKTDPRYCIYDDSHDDYVYTEAWVELLLRDLGADPVGTVSRWKSAVEQGS